RTPLCACGLTSFTPRISRPAACSERMAVSRPEPGPFTNTSTFWRPCSMPSRAAASAVTWAANSVDLRDPLKPTAPALFQTMMPPSLSVSATSVLLNDVLMCACPIAMFLRALRRTRPRVPPLRGAWGNGAYLSLLLALFADGLLGTLAGARVGARALAAHGEAAPVAQAPVAADLHQPLDVLRPLPAQVALNLERLVDVIAQPRDLFLGQVAHLRVGADAEILEHHVGGRAADAVDVGEADLDALLARDVDACDPSHRLPLPLLVPRVGADDQHVAVPADHAAL